MQAYLENLRRFLERLSTGQKVALAAVVLGGIALLVAVSYWAGRPDYTLLFGKLEPGDANKIVETLREQQVPYELKEGGTAVYVPRKDVYELRLRFAGEGVVSDGAIGYELFDRTTLGMTDFMQKLNMKRALEGELARTISNIKQVEVTRVHLVIPERSPFRETQAKPSASVVLQLVGGASLTAAQIEGITSLVAGAVEGLSPSDVTVLDTRGNMLSNPNRDDPAMMAGTSQLRIQRAVEMSLVEKGQSMLDQVLGPGNALVRVTATLDFERAVTEREVIDPESATVISEEKVAQSTGDSVQTANSQTRNYELSRSRERSEKSVGDIAEMTVSVIVNYKAVTGEGGEKQFEPYTEAELREIEQLVKNAVGFKQDRGDRLAIHQTRFDTSSDEQMMQELREQRKQEQMQEYLRYGMQILALLLVVFLVRSALKRITTAEQRRAEREYEETSLYGHEAPGLIDLTADDEPLAGPKKIPAGQPAALQASEVEPSNEEDEEAFEVALVDDVYTRKLSPDARARLRAKHLMFEEIRTEAAERPEDAAELIRSWLAEDATA